MPASKTVKFLYFLEFIKWSLLCIISIYFILMVLIGVESYSDSPDSADAAIVLGASVRGSEPSPVFAERLNHAALLYKEGRVKYIITTGGVEGSSKKFSEGWVGKLYLMELGIPAEDILPETLSNTTYQNIYFGYNIGARHDCKTFLLVSDPLHLPRAVMMAEGISINAKGSATKTSRYQSFSTRMELLHSETLLYMKHLFSKIFFSQINNPKRF